MPLKLTIPLRHCLRGDYFAVKSTTSLKISDQRMRTLVTKRVDTSASIPYRVCQALERPMDELTTIVSGEEKIPEDKTMINFEFSLENEITRS